MKYNSLLQDVGLLHPRPDSVHTDFGALQIIYLLTYLLIVTSTVTKEQQSKT